MCVRCCGRLCGFVHNLFFVVVVDDDRKKCTCSMRCVRVVKTLLLRAVFFTLNLSEKAQQKTCLGPAFSWLWAPGSAGSSAAVFAARRACTACCTAKAPVSRAPGAALRLAALLAATLEKSGAVYS